MSRSLRFHLALIAVLFGLQFILPAYHHGNLSRVMVLAIFAMSYNIMFGYTGLLSLGHAMFFAAGMYGMGLSITVLGLSIIPAFFIGVGTAAILSLIVGLLALRTLGVAFMIVTLMFAQAFYLTILYFNPITRGDEGFVIQQTTRQIAGFDLSDAANRYFAAWLLFSLTLLGILWLVRSPKGRAMIAIRENEERARMLGYDTWRLKLLSVVLSGTVAGIAGAAYGVLFGYVGASFAQVTYSIFPLLWVLLGGPGTVIGPFVGTLFMFYLGDLASSLTDAHMLIVGVVLVLLTLYARKGIMGFVRERWMKWLP